MVSSLLFSSLVASFTASLALESEDTTVLVDNCKDLEDGSYFMKLVQDTEDETYPIVKIKCSNGYAILDVNYDENLKSYFTSWAMWHGSIAGPTNADIVDWDNWFIKSRSDSTNQFLLSPDCNTCEEDNQRQHFGTQTTYWMSGNLFGCYWMILGKHNCDLDKMTYACYDCSDTDAEANGNIVEITEDMDPSAYYYTGQCATAVRASNNQVTASHDTCELGFDWSLGEVDASEFESDYETNVVLKRETLTYKTSKYIDSKGGWDPDEFEGKQIFKPSIGTDGRFCICAKSEVTNYFTVDTSELTKVENSFETKTTIKSEMIKKSNKDEVNPHDNGSENNKENDNDEDSENEVTSENTRIELYQKDFESGTYRIKTPGTYVIMEDISFDFNGGSMDDPQAQNAWKPTESQVDEYPGAGVAQGRDEYFLGFWAGITVESDDVVIDLNDKTLKMSDVFYHQQRWFTIISLNSQFFLPGNGPGFFGYNTKYGSNVVIKDGTIGLSSHFGIHGNYNTNVKISNVHVRDFEVHGIQFNGFDTIEIEDVEVGPSTTMAYLTGEYGHMRFVLDRLNNAIDELDDADEAVMNFYGRDSMTIRDLADKLERMMNYAFYYVMDGTTVSEDSEYYNEYLDALEIFYNPTGIPYASVLHGIFLNTKEASVMNYNLYTTSYSETAKLTNVKIHDLKHSMDERVRLYNNQVMFFGPFQNSLSARQLFNDDDVNDGTYFNTDDIPYKYKGSIVTDTYFALTKYSNSWDYKEHMVTGQHLLVPWSEGESDLPSGTNIACNMDTMIHSGKGTTGLRLDGVRNIEVNNIEIYNLHDSTPQGETVCGNYYDFQPDQGGGHLVQQAPMQTGFSGNMVQAITLNSAYDIEIDTINIHDLTSDTGLTYGLSLWPANGITIKGDLKMDTFNAGAELSKYITDFELPNQTPNACAVMVYEYYTKGDSEYKLEATFDFDSIYGCNMNGFGNECYYFDCGADCTGDEIENAANEEWYDIVKTVNENDCSETGFKKFSRDRSVVGRKQEEIINGGAHNGGAPLNEQLGGALAVAAAVIFSIGLLICAKWKCDDKDSRLKSVYLDIWDHQQPKYGSMITSQCGSSIELNQ